MDQPSSNLECFRLEQTSVPASRMVLRAVLLCALCGTSIAHHGGPATDFICIKCGEALKRGELQGAVVWDKVSDSNA